MLLTDDVSISNCIGTTGTHVALHHELLQTVVDGYYNTFAEQGLSPDLVDTQQNLSWLGQLQLKAYPNIDLINSKIGRPLEFTDISSWPGGIMAM